jgi:hypothetical protein
MSSSSDNVNLGSNKWVNTIASIVLLIVGTVAAIVYSVNAFSTDQPCVIR